MSTALNLDPAGTKLRIPAVRRLANECQANNPSTNLPPELGWRTVSITCLLKTRMEIYSSPCTCPAEPCVPQAAPWALGHCAACSLCQPASAPDCRSTARTHAIAAAHPPALSCTQRLTCSASPAWGKRQNIFFNCSEETSCCCCCFLRIPPQLLCGCCLAKIRNNNIPLTCFTYLPFGGTFSSTSFSAFHCNPVLLTCLEKKGNIQNTTPCLLRNCHTVHPKDKHPGIPKGGPANTQVQATWRAAGSLFIRKEGTSTLIYPTFCVH